VRESDTDQRPVNCVVRESDTDQRPVNCVNRERLESALSDNDYRQTVHVRYVQVLSSVSQS
jgi:hypothetical protein